MSILTKIASALKRRDEVPNQLLAKEIAASNNKAAVKELVENLFNKNKDIANDCIKVIYEVGVLKPALIKDYSKEFIALLTGKNNRMQWGAMTALATITQEIPDSMFNHLPTVLAVADAGTVITKDNAVVILLKLYAIKQYADKTFPLILEQYYKAPTNQLPKYAEDILPIIHPVHKAELIALLTKRINEIEKDTKRARVAKVMKQLSK